MDTVKIKNLQGFLCGPEVFLFCSIQETKSHGTVNLFRFFKDSTQDKG